MFVNSSFSQTKAEINQFHPPVQEWVRPLGLGLIEGNLSSSRGFGECTENHISETPKEITLE